MQNDSFLIRIENSFIAYLLTKDPNYKDQYTKNILQICSEEIPLKEFQGILIGPCLIFYSIQTQEETIKKQIELLKEQALLLSNAACFTEKIKAFPFLMAYETMINQKENYRELVQKIQDLKEEFYTKETGLYGTTLEEDSIFLNMLADCVLLASEEMFEYYQVLRIQLREAIHGVLLHQNPRTGFYGEEETTCLENSARIAIAIWKACRCNAVLSCKYQNQSFKTANSLLGSFTDSKLLPYEILLREIREV